MITASGLSLDRAGRRVLDDVGLEVAAGRVTVAVGPNGAGKSTLLKVLSGELRPGAGTVLLGDRPLAGFGPRALARRRAVLPQHGAPTFPLTVHEIVALGARAAGERPAEAVERALAAVGLAGWGGRSYARLSGGERQRVQLARALAQVPRPVGDDGPRALFLDEPTSNLDLARQIEVLEAARRFARDGGAVFVVLHDLNLAAEFADAVVVIAAGRIVDRGAPTPALFERVVADVYDLPGAASRMPAFGTAYVLPQARAGARPALDR